MEDLIKLQQAQIEALQKELEKTRNALQKAKDLLTEIFNDATENN